MAKDRTYTGGHIELRVDGKLAKTGYVNQVASTVNQMNSPEFGESLPGHLRLPSLIVRLDSAHTKDNIYYATVMVGHCTIDLNASSFNLGSSMEDGEHVLFWDMSRRGLTGHPLRVGANEYYPGVALGSDISNNIPVIVPLWGTAIKDIRWNGPTRNIQSTLIPDPEDSEWVDKILFESCDTTAQMSEQVQNSSLAYRLSMSSVTNPR